VGAACETVPITPSRLLLTHTDLDGVGAAVIWSAATGAPYRLVENGEVDAAVARALPEAEEIVLADHSVGWDLVPAIEAHLATGRRFTMLDHHKSAMALAVHPWARVHLDRAASGLLFDFVGRPAELADFAALVEDHDLWRHSDPRSAKLAALLGLLGHERFIERFTGDPRVEFTPAEELLMEVEDRRREDYIARKVKLAEVVGQGAQRWAIAFAEQYQSDVAEALMAALGVNATAIVNASRGTVSMRGRDIDVSLIARHFGGGGHARAAAFSVAGKPLEAGLVEFRQALVRALLDGAPG
jgi:oligoribonuclease NrnB/cAMP/cGMP phosphodiesterase (DHH superfamily)